MIAKQNLFGISLIVLVIWTAIIVIGQNLQATGTTSLDDLVSQQVVISLVVAPLFILGVVAYFKWRQPVGLKAADPARSWLLLWLPALFILGFLGVGLLSLPPWQAVMFILINTLLVGISEELMFRGIVFYGALSRFDIWPAILITTILFGGVHALNGFLTGDFVTALAQSLSAAMSGIWLMSIRLRTKSLYPAIVIHWLWDFGLFVFVSALQGIAASPPSATDTSLVQKFAFPVLLVLPLFLYGLWLLRGIGKKEKEEVLS